MTPNCQPNIARGLIVSRCQRGKILRNLVMRLFIKKMQRSYVKSSRKCLRRDARSGMVTWIFLDFVKILYISRRQTTGIISSGYDNALDRVVPYTSFSALNEYNLVLTEAISLFTYRIRHSKHFVPRDDLRLCKWRLNKSKPSILLLFTYFEVMRSTTDKNGCIARIFSSKPTDT